MTASRIESWEQARLARGCAGSLPAMASTSSLEEEEEVVVTELTSLLLAEDAKLRASYPVGLDLSSPRFQLGSLAGLAIVRAGVMRELRLDGNMLASLAGIERFVALRVLSAQDNLLEEAAVRCPRLQELVLCGNRLTAVPRLAGCGSLRSLSLERNAICGGYEHLRGVPKLQALRLRANRVGTAGSAEHASLGRELSALLQESYKVTKFQSFKVTN